MDHLTLILVLPLLVLTVALVRFPRRAGPGEVRAQAALVGPGAVWAAGAPLLGRIFPWLVVLAIVAGVVAVLHLVQGALNIFELVLLCRYSLLTGLLLAGLVLLGLVALPSLLANLFTLRNPWQLFHLTWLALLVATMVTVTARVVEHNACDRYGVAALTSPRDHWGLLRWATVLVLAVPVPYACLRRSLAELPGESAGRWLLIGLVGGLAAGLGLVVLAAAVQEVFLKPAVQIPDLFPFQRQLSWLREALGIPRSEALYPLGDGIAWLLTYLDRRGYCVPGSDPPVLAAGHAQAIAGMSAVLAFYLGNYLTISLLHLVPDAHSRLPSLFYLLLLFLLLGFLFQGIAFALDLFRIPALLAVALFSFVLYRFTRTDHFYELAPAAEAAPRTTSAPAPVPTGPPTLAEAAGAWKLPPVSLGKGGRQDLKTLVAVTASGGGIQASAWISRVLVGLHQLYGEDLTRSIGLVSAVSGGSVGVMYYLDRWQARSPTFPAEALAFGPDGRAAADSICGRAMASSLEATAWGLVFPDLLRIGFPPLVSHTDDRGARIEDAWRSRLDSPDARLTDWAGRIRRGEMPIPVFNATLVETGQRLLCSPVLYRPPGGPAPGPIQARELLELYPAARPRVSTAVRLSATFPFISPICRPLPLPESSWREQDAYHCADGGYVDNEGMVTVIEWLNALLDGGGALAFDQVLLIRLMPFPEEVSAAPAKQGEGWLYSTVGPIEALQNVRTASQAGRNNLAVDLFSEAARRKGVRVEAATFTFESADGMSPPLSWMLTEAQKDEVERAWALVLAGNTSKNPLATVDRFFRRAGSSRA